MPTGRSRVRAIRDRHEARKQRRTCGRVKGPWAENHELGSPSPLGGLGGFGGATDAAAIAAARASAAPAHHPYGGDRDRDDCASTVSFATTQISVGSTQISAPVLLTELPAAGRGFARVGGGGGIGGMGGALASAAGGGGVMAAFSSALAGGPGAGDVPEELSREQLEGMMRELLRGGGGGGGGSSGDGAGSGGNEDGDDAAAAAERRSSAAVALAVHAERDDELRAAIVGAGLLPEITAMLQVRYGRRH